MADYSHHFFSPESTNNSWSNMYQFIPEGARVLDVGCSTGTFGEALQQLKACTVVGVDIAADDIAVARTRLSEAYVMDITTPGAALSLGKFDVVIFADVIEHLPDPRGTLRAVHDLLAEDGVVVYSIPHMGHLSVRLDLLEGRFPYTDLGLLDRTHLHFYDRLEVHDVLASADFMISAELPTVTGYPEALIADRLLALGLTPSPEFFAMLRNTEANVFQYVGTAIPRGQAPVVPTLAREVVTPLDEVLEYGNRAVAENVRLAAEVQVMRERFAGFRERPVRAVVGAAWRRFTRRR